ncbi:MAG: hypothetical protein M3O55_02055 [Actinomycetota bacterium]|nr:hypothetical protein [Actinomycetota bacterium]
MAQVSRRWAWLLIAAAGLLLAWLAAPAAPPLYDGVGFPDEPYRYVTRPVGDTKVTKPPSWVAVRMPVSDGTTDGFNAASTEQGPQISVFVPTGTLTAPKDAHTLLLRADPRTPDGPADGGKVDGNVYRLTATADIGKPSVARAQDTIQIIMRATSAKQPGPTMEYRAQGAQKWTRLKTARYGNDVYASSAKGFGDYALVFAPPLPGAAKPAGKSGIAKYAYVLIVAGLLILLISVVLGIRLARARRAALA